MNSKNIVLFSMLCAGLAVGCEKSATPELNRYQVGIAYGRGDLSAVERTISQSKSEYSDYEFFPYSINLLVKNSLSSGDSRLFDKALSSTEAMSERWVDKDLSAYSEFIPYLKANGLKTSFSGSRSDQCVRITKTLERMFVDAVWLGDLAKQEGAYWYSLYANSGCSWAGNRSTYVALLADVDVSRAKGEIDRLKSLPNWTAIDTENLQNQVCYLRKFYTDVKASGPEKLDRLGLLSCGPLDSETINGAQGGQK